MKLVDSTLCCGCGACAYVCKKEAIALEKDVNGFVYAKINESECLSCGKCQKVCPIINNKSVESSASSYGAISTDEDAKRSASGGIFALIAKKFIEKGGVVFGTEMDSDFNVKVVQVTQISELYRLQGSKYVQSDLSCSFEQIERALKEGANVLFGGTPCQVSAVKNLFSKYDNLYLIDIICHGVGNLQMFKQSVQNLNFRYSRKITGLTFRDKKYGHRVIGSITFENGRSKRLPSHKYDYYSLFLKNSILAPSCHNCKYSNTQRPGDITLGDYWRVLQEEPQFYDKCVKQGYFSISSVIVNTRRGLDLFETLKDNMIYQQTSIEKIKKGNPNLYTPTKANADRDKCLEIYSNGGYRALSKYYHKKYRRQNLTASIYSALPPRIVAILKKFR